MRSEKGRRVSCRNPRRLLRFYLLTVVNLIIMFRLISLIVLTSSSFPSLLVSLYLTKVDPHNSSTVIISRFWN